MTSCYEINDIVKIGDKHSKLGSEIQPEAHSEWKILRGRYKTSPMCSSTAEKHSLCFVDRKRKALSGTPSHDFVDCQLKLAFRAGEFGYLDI